MRSSTSRTRGAEVLLFHDLLTETLEDRERASGPEPQAAPRGGDRGLLARADRLDERDAADELATKLTGGVILEELPEDIVAAVERFVRPTSLSRRSESASSCGTRAWIYGGVSINSMYWPARQNETLNLEAVYRFHPRFRDAGFPIWFGGVDHDWGRPRSRAAT